MPEPRDVWPVSRRGFLQSVAAGSASTQLGATASPQTEPATLLAARKASQDFRKPFVLEDTCNVYLIRDGSPRTAHRFRVKRDSQPPGRAGGSFDLRAPARRTFRASALARFIDYGSASWNFFSSFLQATDMRPHAFVEHSIDTLRARHGLKSIDVAMPSHMHDGHLNGFPHLARKFKTRIWRYENTVAILENRAAVILGRAFTWSYELSVGSVRDRSCQVDSKHSRIRAAYHCGRARPAFSHRCRYALGTWMPR